ncbi:hypothetical protein QL285_004466 [Trifolium repens]|nr:hypothetical protein QL285_004466 [Trifolium repens]
MLRCLERKQHLFELFHCSVRFFFFKERMKHTLSFLDRTLMNQCWILQSSATSTEPQINGTASDLDINEEWI